MLQVYNEHRFLAACIEHLREQGVAVYVIDNESTDDTLAIAERYLGRGVIGIETAPRHGVFALRDQCERQEELACTLEADWLIHHDADEFRVSSKHRQTLGEAVAEADEAGFDAINFLEFVFVPTREFPDHDHAAFRRTMRWYYPFLPSYPHRVSAWKRREERVDLKTTAGHLVRFEGQRLAPQSLYMRHYLYISLEHAREKFVRRRFAADEVADGWFGWRPRMTEETITLPSVSDLRPYVADHLLDPSEPSPRHLLDPQTSPSAAPGPLSKRPPTAIASCPSRLVAAAVASESSKPVHPVPEQLEPAGRVKIVVRLSSGHEVAFDVDADRDAPACFLLSIAKCGSTLLNRIGRTLAHANGVNFVDPFDNLLTNDVRSRGWTDVPPAWLDMPAWVEPAMTSILRRGNAYGGYREAPIAFFEHPVFVEGPKILLVRDPRDALVSQYFWFARPLPEAGATPQRLEKYRSALASDIDSWVVTQARRVAQMFRGYFPLLGSATLTVLRYEDYIFEKAQLIAVVADRFGWKVDADLLREMLNWADVRPTTEVVTAHVRQVTPGDHRDKLRPDTINALNAILAPVLETFNYARAA